MGGLDGAIGVFGVWCVCVWFVVVFVVFVCGFVVVCFVLFCMCLRGREVGIASPSSSVGRAHDS